MRLADDAPHLGAVNRVPGSEGPAPVEDHRVYSHRGIISAATSRRSARTATDAGGDGHIGIACRDVKRQYCGGQCGKDWLRRHVPVALSLVLAFNVTCRTLRYRRIAAHEEDRMHKLQHNGRRVFAKGVFANGVFARAVSAKAVAAASAAVVSSLALAGA